VKSKGDAMRTMAISLALACAVAGATWYGWPAAPPSPVRSSSSDFLLREALGRAENNLAWADRKSRHALEHDLAVLDEFFDNVKQRTPRFANVVLGWGSKWRFVADKTPFTKGDRHAEFLRRAFDEQLFTPDDLRQAIEQATNGFADDLAAIENRMLLKIREDVGDLPAAELPELANESSWLAAYEAALSRASLRAGDDVTADAATSIVSLAACEVLTQLAVRMGASAGILSVGAGSSVATFGAGLVVGLIVDQLVSWVWEWWADPRGNLAADLDRRFDELRDLIVEGDSETRGLRSSLSAFAQRRADARRAAVLGMIGTAR
jgi:hypothetical protein